MNKDDAWALIMLMGFATFAGSIIAMAFGIAIFKGEKYAVIGLMGVGGAVGFFWGPVLWNQITGNNKPAVYESTAQVQETDVPLIVNIGDQEYSRTKCGLDEEGWQDLAGVIVRAGYRFSVTVLQSAYGSQAGRELYSQVVEALKSGGLLVEKGKGVEVTDLGRHAFDKLTPTTPHR